MARLPTPGEVAEWLKAADCKSARASVRWFESSPLHHRFPHRRTKAVAAPIAPIAPVFPKSDETQLDLREFDSRKFEHFRGFS